MQLFVDPKGRDGNPGTAELPFATLSGARDGIRRLKVDGPLQELLTVNVRAGTYYLKEPLLLSPEDSGVADCPIIYRAVGDEMVVISGGQQLDRKWRELGPEDIGLGWRTAASERGVDLSKAPLYMLELPECRNPNLRKENLASAQNRGLSELAPAPWNFRQLFVDGVRAPRAGYPNPKEGYRGYEYVRGGVGNHTILAPNRVSWVSAPDSLVDMMAGPMWYNTIARIKSIEGDHINLVSPTLQYAISQKKKNVFRVHGVLEELDSPGEWYLDTQLGRLYYWAPSGDPNEHDIVAPRLHSLIDIQADFTKKEYVEHIRFEGFFFQHSRFRIDLIEGRSATDGAIRLQNARNCSVTGCRFQQIGGYAVWMHLDCRGNNFSYNEVKDAGAGGVYMSSARLSYMDPSKTFTPNPEAADLAPTQNTISHNHIHHTGVLRYYTAGVHMDSRPASRATEAGAKITHNHFHHLPRNGIFVNRNQGGILIAYNEIHDVALFTEDCACVHLATMNRVSAPIYVLNNLVYDVHGTTAQGPGSRWWAVGIYLDWGTSFTTVRNNGVFNTVGGSIASIMGGIHNEIDNNIVTDHLEARIPHGGPVARGWPQIRSIEGDIHLDYAQVGLRGDADSGIGWDDLTHEAFTLDYSEDRYVDIIGEWEERTVAHHLYDYTYLAAQGGKTEGKVIFRIPINTTGLYEVYLNHPQGDGVANVSLQRGEDTSEKTVNMKEGFGDPNWQLIGSYTFYANRGNTVSISTRDGGGTIHVQRLALVSACSGPGGDR